MRAFFIGGPADGTVREFDSRPPDRMQATPDGQGQLLDAKPTTYNRNDLTGGTVIYVPAGGLLHDAFVRVLESYAETATAKREAKEG